MRFSARLDATLQCLIRAAYPLVGYCLALFWAGTTASAQPTETLWIPAPLARFDWQLSEPFDLKHPVDILDLDLFEAMPQDIARLKAQGVRLVCYINAGAWEDWREDAKDFPPQILGKSYEGWEGERWLDIRAINSLKPILEARFDLCRDKGFDAVEPDNIDGYDNKTGFPLTAADQVRFNRWLAQMAHDRGLSIALKNTPDLLPQLIDSFDWALAEDCLNQNWCQALTPMVQAGKAVFAVEYTDQIPDQSSAWLNACNRAKSLGIAALLKDRELSSFVKRCK